MEIQKTSENSETEADNWEGDLGKKPCDLVKEFWYEVSRELPLKKFVKKRVPTYMLETSCIQAIQEIQTRAEGGVCELHKVEATKCPPNEGTRTSCVLLYQMRKIYTLHPGLKPLRCPAQP